MDIETDEGTGCWLIGLKFRFKDRGGFEWNLNGGDSTGSDTTLTTSIGPSRRLLRCRLRGRRPRR